MRTSSGSRARRFAASPQRDVAGQLRFQIGMLDVSNNKKPDFEPIVINEKLRIAGHQLGVETALFNGPTTRYQREFSRMDELDIVVLPIQSSK